MCTPPGSGNKRAIVCALLLRELRKRESSLATNEAKIVELDTELQRAHRMRDQDVEAIAALRELLAAHQD